MDSHKTEPQDTARNEASIQSIKALLIPLSLFLASLTASAGGFLIYNGYRLGFIFIGAGLITIIGAFIAFIKFQKRSRT